MPRITAAGSFSSQTHPLITPIITRPNIQALPYRRNLGLPLRRSRSLNRPELRPLSTLPPLPPMQMQSKMRLRPRRRSTPVSCLLPSGPRPTISRRLAKPREKALLLGLRFVMEPDILENVFVDGLLRARHPRLVECMFFDGGAGEAQGARVERGAGGEAFGLEDGGAAGYILRGLG